MKKKITIAVILLICLIVNSTYVSALSWSQIQSQADSFLSMGSGNSVGLESAIQPTIISVGNILTTIGLAVVLTGILIIGIKYMMASPEEAAKLKGQLVGLVISAIVIFGAWGIWSLVVQILQSLTGTGGFGGGSSAGGGAGASF